VATTQQQIQPAIEATERDVDAAAADKDKDFARVLKSQQQVSALHETEHRKKEQPTQQDQQPQQPLPLATEASSLQPTAAAAPPLQAPTAGSPDTPPPGQEHVCIQRLLELRMRVHPS
jgi:hypothetical protein